MLTVKMNWQVEAATSKRQQMFINMLRQLRITAEVIIHNPERYECLTVNMGVINVQVYMLSDELVSANSHTSDINQVITTYEKMAILIRDEAIVQTQKKLNYLQKRLDQLKRNQVNHEA